MNPLVISQWDNRPELYQACIDGDLDRVKFRVEVCKDIINNYTDKFDEPPIVLAAMGNHFHIVKYLVEHGADVNKPCWYPVNALNYACRHGNIEMIKYLISHGASPDGRCLSHACFNSSASTPETVNYSSLQDSFIRLKGPIEYLLEEVKVDIPDDILLHAKDPKIFRYIVHHTDIDVNTQLPKDKKTTLMRLCMSVEETEDSAVEKVRCLLGLDEEKKEK